MREQGCKSKAVQCDGEGFPQYDDSGERTPRNGSGPCKETEVVIRCNRKEYKNGEPAGKPSFLLHPLVIFLNQGSREEPVEQGPSIVTGQGESSQGTGDNAHIIVDQPFPYSEGQYPDQTAKAAGKDGNHHLDSLERHKEEG